MPGPSPTTFTSDCVPNGKDMVPKAGSKFDIKSVFHTNYSTFSIRPVGGFGQWQMARFPALFQEKSRVLENNTLGRPIG
jgi:hypothetical protein